MKPNKHSIEMLPNNELTSTTSAQVNSQPTLRVAVSEIEQSIEDMLSTPATGPEPGDIILVAQGPKPDILHIGIEVGEILTGQNYTNVVHVAVCVSNNPITVVEVNGTGVHKNHLERKDASGFVIFRPNNPILAEKITDIANNIFEAHKEKITYSKIGAITSLLPSIKRRSEIETTTYCSRFAAQVINEAIIEARLDKTQRVESETSPAGLGNQLRKRPELFSTALHVNKSCLDQMFHVLKSSKNKQDKLALAYAQEYISGLEERAPNGISTEAKIVALYYQTAKRIDSHTKKGLDKVMNRYGIYTPYREVMLRRQTIITLNRDLISPAKGIGL